MCLSQSDYVLRGRAVMHPWVDMMVYDRGGMQGQAMWMENVLPGGGTNYPSHTGVVSGYGHTPLRSLPPYHPPPPPARYHYPTYNSPWLVRVSAKVVSEGNDCPDVMSVTFKASLRSLRWGEGWLLINRFLSFTVMTNKLNHNTKVL